MAKFLRTIFRFIVKRISRLIDNFIRILPVYYKSINQIPLYNWFQIRDNKLTFLYKTKLIKRIPYFFDEIIMNMVFEIESVDLTFIKKRAELAIMQSIAARTNNKTVKFQADVMAKELEEREKKDIDRKGIELNEFIDYIELTFNQIGRIDPYKISAGRALSLLDKAIKHNKRLVKQAEKLKQ